MAENLPNDISEEQLKIWIIGIRGTIWYLLETMEYLLTDLAEHPIRKKNVELVTTALYTHALEEYGKLVLLATLEPTGNRVVLDPIRNELRNHNVKIQVALEDLPDDCGKIIKDTFDPTIVDTRIFQTHNSIDWNTRLDIFNTDIDLNGDVHHTPRIDLSGLQLAINKFRTAHFTR